MSKKKFVFLLLLFFLVGLFAVGSLVCIHYSGDEFVANDIFLVQFHHSDTLYSVQYAQCFAQSACLASRQVYLGKQLLGIFNDDPVVIETGIIRLRYILLAEGVNVVIEICSGCMRGYGRSMVPALLCMGGICGVRISWVYTAFRMKSTFPVLLTAYPLSWVVTSIALAIAYFWMKNHSMKDFFSGEKNIVYKGAANDKN